MNTAHRGLVLALAVCLATVTLCSVCTLEPLQNAALSGAREPGFVLPGMGCTVLYASDKDVALGGNNEDFQNPQTMAWFLPPEDNKFGRVYFGYEGFLWGGGMNDQGLFFDAMAVDEPVRVERDGKPMYAGSLPDKALSECNTVDCVIALYETYHTYDTWQHQFLFGDALGNSVIVEPLQILRNDKYYQVGTNFYQSSTDVETCSYCDRFRTATQMFEQADEVSVDLVRDVLKAVHLEGAYPTLYSMVYDLNALTVTLYHFHDFEHVRVLDLAEELAQGPHSYRLRDLFPENPAFDTWAQPMLDSVERVRAKYQKVRLLPEQIEDLVGTYRVPETMGLPYQFHSVTLRDGDLYLEILPDKAWLLLTPIAERSFYHATLFYEFEIDFETDISGRVDRFVYRDSRGEHIFERAGERPWAVPKATLTPTATPMPTASVTPASAEASPSPEAPTATASASPTRRPTAPAALGATSHSDATEIRAKTPYTSPPRKSEKVLILAVLILTVAGIALFGVRRRT